MAGEAAPGAGDIPIDLVGVPDAVLKPTLHACETISKMHGGLAAAVIKCRNLDFDLVAEVIALGLNATSAMQRKQVREAVYLTGTINCAAVAMLFIRTVANGGVRPNDEEADEEEARPLDEQLPSSSTTPIS